MRLLIFLLFVCAGGAFAIAETDSKGQPSYMRFPETVSPDGAYVLAWGNSLNDGIDPNTLVEAPAASWIDPSEFEIQDYLVETKRTQPPLVLRKFAYFSGPRGHEDKAGLSVTWSPDSRAVLAVYEGASGYRAAIWADPVDGLAADVGRTFELKLRELVAETFGAAAEKARTNVFFTRMAVLEPGLITIDGTLSQLTGELVKPTSYCMRMRFNIKMEGDISKVELVGHRVVLADELLAAEPVHKGDSLDDQIERWVANLRAKMPPEEAEGLKREQSLWVRQRDALASPGNRFGFTRHRLEELKIRAADYKTPTRATPPPGSAAAPPPASSGSSR